MALHPTPEGPKLAKMEPGTERLKEANKISTETEDFGSLGFRV